MTHRIEQVNELLRGELAQLINREVFLRGGMVTVSYVECSPDMRYAKVGISVLPDALAETALKKIRKHDKLFSYALKKKLDFKYIPKFDWIFDERERHAAEIEDLLKQV